MEIPSKRCRTSNWDRREKRLLLKAVSENINQIQMKNRSVAANIDRTEAWKRVQIQLEAAGFYHDHNRIKEQWMHLRLSAKQNINAYNEALKMDSNLPPKPRTFDYRLAKLALDEICLPDVKGESDCDSNASVHSDEITEIDDAPDVKMTSEPDIEEIIVIHKVSQSMPENILEPAEVTTPQSSLPKTSTPSVAAPEVVSRTSPLMLSASPPPPVIQPSIVVKQKEKERRLMTEYEWRMLQLNQQRMEQTMQHADELHQLHMQHEIEAHREKMRLMRLAHGSRDY